MSLAEVLTLPVVQEEVFTLPVVQEEVLTLPVVQEKVLALPVVQEKVLTLPVVQDVLLQDIKRKVEDLFPMEEAKKARSDKSEESDDEEEDVYDSDYDHCFEILDVDAFDHAVTKIAARKGDNAIYKKHMNYIIERKREKDYAATHP
jgi:hypothetical protein